MLKPENKGGDHGLRYALGGEADGVAIEAAARAITHRVTTSSTNVIASSVARPVTQIHVIAFMFDLEVPHTPRMLLRRRRGRRQGRRQGRRLIGPR